ncbi:hypothetical protein H8F18_08745 [Vibrio fluvialis]|uniref:hypothetical protein n=1 Tax=Vibrio fluvialis TaxID=676 RepID=UPI00192B2A69|nr:hypothetical protein [Vibrio fluvialis]MBL4242571.1 hypothetical protein [Vibrio fluvialis]MBL4251379.1 hypothetical protein [Vibrio fluvialis]MBY8097203.1 hypothetical protein [Vibrio fluvialis]
MNDNEKERSCHTGKGKHKAHGWMMLLCVLLMVGVPLLVLTSSMSKFSPSLLGTALLPLILCLIMHGVMMKFMMTGNTKNQAASEENQVKKEVPMVEEKTNNSGRFIA